ncbi:MAG: phosphoenolpyruvate synthase [Gemmatimonadaceae bacterium]
MRWIRWFADVGIADVAAVGGKNASLGEMRRHLAAAGVPVPDGFALTADAFRHFLSANQLEQPLSSLMKDRATLDANALESRAAQARDLIQSHPIPDEMRAELTAAYAELSRRLGGGPLQVAVRSSATAEDLPTASFAGAHQTFLNVQGANELVDAVRRCYASLYTPRAIRYRADMGFNEKDVALSVGVQQMIPTDRAVSGVIFTLDPETGFPDVVVITSIYGMGENIVQGRVGPDEFHVHKPTLARGKRPILRRKVGAKEFRLVFDEAKRVHVNLPVPAAERQQLSLTDDEVLQLATWACAIEAHYSEVSGHPTPMDIEFARDGVNGGLYILQARPETIHSAGRQVQLTQYELEEQGTVLLEGIAVGERIASGAARVLKDASMLADFRAGEVLVTESTDPDWEPILKQAAGVVTARGGRTSHAAIVSRELGIPAVVGAVGATERLKSGQDVTVSCAEGDVGHVYGGRLRFREDAVDLRTLPATRTKIMVNAGEPERAYKLAMLPNDGVGLARMEFIFAGWVKVHPLALTRYDTLDPVVKRQVDVLTAGYADKKEYFVDVLSQGIGTLAAAFWPRPVILRFSDFKSNEYAHLLGGASFEDVEANPMLGWRGASRYYNEGYREGFLLEVAAVRRVRDVMGLTNLQLMIPFCRTPEEGRRVLDVMKEGGLERGVNELKVLVMAEIPSNVILAAEFASLFDGFSIGSNDLTQLTLGVDRDATRVAALFDERNEAVKRSCATLISAAHAAGRTVGICGQAPSDYPEFAEFLVEHGIDSISLNADALVRTRRSVAAAEERVLAAV